MWRLVLVWILVAGFFAIVLSGGARAQQDPILPEQDRAEGTSVITIDRMEEELVSEVSLRQQMAAIGAAIEASVIPIPLQNPTYSSQDVRKDVVPAPQS